MGLVIYRKSDNKVMMEVVQYPLHDPKIFEKFIASGGHKVTEFGVIEIAENEMPMAEQKEIVIQNGKITFGNDRPKPPTETPMTPTVEQQLAERDKEITELKVRQKLSDQMALESSMAQQDLLELLIEMGVI